jgi:hypothetical protein
VAGTRFSRRQSLKAFASVAVSQSAPPVAFAGRPQIRLIVLDVGGTIIEDRGDVPDALQSAFEKHGIKVTPEEIALWRGASKREVVRHFATERSTVKAAALDMQVAAQGRALALNDLPCHGGLAREQRRGSHRGGRHTLLGASKEERLRPEPHTDLLPSVAELPGLIVAKY